MRVYYTWLFLGELPVSSAAKSRGVHVWVPRRGWVRQSNPVRRKTPLPKDPNGTLDRNVIIPMMAMPMNRYRRWLRDHKATLGHDHGAFVVFVREAQPDWIQFGILHEGRAPWCRVLAGEKKNPKIPRHVPLPADC